MVFVFCLFLPHIVLIKYKSLYIRYNSTFTEGYSHNVVFTTDKFYLRSKRKIRQVNNSVPNLFSYEECIQWYCTSYLHPHQHHLIAPITARSVAINVISSGHKFVLNIPLIEKVLGHLQPRNNVLIEGNLIRDELPQRGLQMRVPLLPKVRHLRHHSVRHRVRPPDHLLQLCIAHLLLRRLLLTVPPVLHRVLVLR